MARKQSAQAEQDRKKREFNTWRLLVRNPNFKNDLASLRHQATEAGTGPAVDQKQAILHRMKEREQVANKWGLSRIPPIALYPYMDDDPQSLERCYLNQGDDKGPYPITFPIVALTELKEERYLHWWADTTQPVEAILAAFEGELREFYRLQKAKGRRGRPDSLEFQLKVFDLVTGTAETPKSGFNKVALKLRRSPSTIREAYGSICRKIGIASKKETTHVPPTDPGPISECNNLRCREAQSVEDICEAHRGWSELDQVSQGDYLPEKDISIIEHAASRSGRTKRQPGHE